MRERGGEQATRVLSLTPAPSTPYPQAEVTAVQDECTRDLAAAEPAVAAAAAALSTLDKASLGELKSFGSPSYDVVAVLAACMVLTAPAGKIPKVRVGGGRSFCEEEVGREKLRHKQLLPNISTKKQYPTHRTCRGLLPSGSWATWTPSSSICSRLTRRTFRCRLWSR